MTEVAYQMLLPHPIRFDEYNEGFFVPHTPNRQPGPLHYKPWGLDGSSTVEDGEYDTRSPGLKIVPVKVRIQVVAPLYCNPGNGAGDDAPGY